MLSFQSSWYCNFGDLLITFVMLVSLVIVVNFVSLVVLIVVTILVILVSVFTWVSSRCYLFSFVMCVDLGSFDYLA